MARQGLTITLLEGARELLQMHARELPQRDDLCGAFCGALALGAAGLTGQPSAPLDQDAVALAAGSVISPAREAGTLPRGEQGRRDYRLVLPEVSDPSSSGTTAAGVVRALAELSGGRIAPIPYSGPWSEHTLAGLFDLAAALVHPVTLIANLATRHLWGASPSLEQLLAQLVDGVEDGPPPDWDVGHFACIVGRVQGPRGSLYVLADTYPSLGRRGVHLQPPGALAAAIARPDMPAGGIIVAVSMQEAAAVRSGAGRLGLVEEVWDNGTVLAGTAP